MSGMFHPLIIAKDKCNAYCFEMSRKTSFG